MWYSHDMAAFPGKSPFLAGRAAYLSGLKKEIGSSCVFYNEWRNTKMRKKIELPVSFPVLALFVTIFHFFL